MEGKKTFEEHWTEIEENFDWERVRSVMQFLDWTWRGSPTPPTITDLKLCAMERCQTVFRTDTSVSRSGGFVAEYHKEGDYLTLTFALDMWETDDGL